MRRVPFSASAIIAGCAAMIALAGSLTYAAAGVSFTPPDWTLATTAPDADLRDVEFAGEGPGCAVGGGGTIALSDDAGVTWTAADSGTTSTLNALALSPDESAVAVGDAGVVQASADWMVWTARPSGTETDLLGVDFAGTMRGCAVGRGGTIVLTTDGGDSWSVRSACVGTATLRGVAFVDERNGWVWGDDGIVARTGDAGSTWTTASIAASGAVFHAGAFVDDKTGWVAGSGGLIMKTTDGGATWTTQTVDTTASIFGISFADAEHGFVVGGLSPSQTRFMAGTSDGGATWVPQVSEGTRMPRAIQFDSATRAWIVGDGGLVLRTVASEAPASVDASAPVLDAPVGVYARALDSGEVLVGWGESIVATAPATYRVRRSVAGHAFTTLALVPSEDGPHLTDTTAPEREDVAYRVSVIDPSGESSPSAAFCIETKARPQRGDVPPARMTCTKCHTVHVEAIDPVYPGVEGRCIECHRDLGEELSGEGSGTRHDLRLADQAVNGSRIDCGDCHNPHSSSETTPIVDPDDPSPAGGMKRVTDAFCLRCHDNALPTPVGFSRPLSPRGAATAGRDIRATWGSAAATTGMDVHGFGVSAGGGPRLRPNMGYAKGDVLSCVTCHDPHGSTNRWMLLESVPAFAGSRHARALLVRCVSGSGGDLRHFCSGCHRLTSHPKPSAGGADLSRWPIDCTGCHSHGHGL